MQERKLFAATFSTLVVSTLVFLILGTTTAMTVLAQQSTNATGTAEPHEETGEHAGNATTVRDSTAVLLSGETIPAGSFIHLYDSTPDAIATGHVAAKIPCNENSNATLNSNCYLNYRPPVNYACIMLIWHRNKVEILLPILQYKIQVKKI